MTTWPGARASGTPAARTPAGSAPPRRPSTATRRGRRVERQVAGGRAPSDAAAGARGAAAPAAGPAARRRRTAWSGSRRRRSRGRRPGRTRRPWPRASAPAPSSARPAASARPCSRTAAAASRRGRPRRSRRSAPASSPAAPSPARSTTKPSAVSPRAQGGGQPRLVLHHQQPHAATHGTAWHRAAPRSSAVSGGLSQRRRTMEHHEPLHRPPPRSAGLLPVAAVAVIGGGAADRATTRASADPALPPRTAAQLLVDVQHGAARRPVRHRRADAPTSACPSLPGARRPGRRLGIADLARLRHAHLRVWYDGPTGSGSPCIGTLGESDVIRNGTDVWLWSSADKTAAHHTLAAGHGAADGRPTPGAAADRRCRRTPQRGGRRGPRRDRPDHRRSPRRARPSVAGRSAYELVLTPRDTASLVGSVRIAIDAREARPAARAGLLARSWHDPAFEVGFTAVDFAQPDARQFAFTPPPGTTVDRAHRRVRAQADQHRAGDRTAAADAGRSPTVVGTGWTAVAGGPLPAGRRSRGAGGRARRRRARSRRCPRSSGTWAAGTLLSGTLFSALLTDDGRVAVGAVAPERLYAPWRSDPAADCQVDRGATPSRSRPRADQAVRPAGRGGRHRPGRPAGLGLRLPRARTARARRRRSGCCSAWSSRPPARRSCSGSRCRSGAGRRAAPGRRPGRGAGLPPLPVRPGQPARLDAADLHRATRAPPGGASTPRSTGWACWPRPASATAPTPWACGSGSPSPPRCCGPATCSCSTSRPTASTRRAPARCAPRRVAGRRRHHGVRLEPPAVRGGADLHPPRRDARRPARRPGHASPRCAAAAARRGAGADATSPRPPRVMSRARASSRCDRGAGEVHGIPGDAGAGEDRRGARARGRRRPGVHGRDGAASRTCSSSLTGEGFDVSG